MSTPLRPADRDELVINPILGTLDVVRIFDPNRILTHERNSSGTLYSTFDTANGVQVSDGPRVVVDNNGNVVFL